MNMTHLVPTSIPWMEPFVAAGVFGPTEIHLAATLATADPGAAREVLLGAALVARAPQHGSACVEIETVRHTVVSTLTEPYDQGTDDSDQGYPAVHGSAGYHDGSGDQRLDDDPDYLPIDGTSTAIAVEDLDWPEPQSWADKLAASSLVHVVGGEATPELQPLVLDGSRLYLARHWHLERYVAADLAGRARAGLRESASDSTADVTRASIAKLFELDSVPTGSRPDPDQVAAAAAVADSGLVVIAGGPGTGKTTTVAHLLAGLMWARDGAAVNSNGPDDATPDDSLRSPGERIALVAPTGKAAARMTEAIRHAVGTLADHLPVPVVAQLQSLEAVTVHRLLGRRGAGFMHGPDNPLPHDLVIVDEVSMVSLSLMAHLLAAIPTQAKVVLVGDPYQLASVEAGTVLGDVVGMRASPDGEAAPPSVLTSSVRSLSTVHRQKDGSAILELAAAIRAGRADDVIALLNAADGVELRWIDTDSAAGTAGPAPAHHRQHLENLVEAVRATATNAVHAATTGDVDTALAAIGSVKLLCALRRGPDGVDHWNRAIEDHLRHTNTIRRGDWYAGRPTMVTENDYLNRVFNGDVGVALPATTDVVDGPDAAAYRVVFARSDSTLDVPAIRLDRVTTQWAMSIHKSQGSEFAHAVVILPPPPARILTRELLYTGVTRAKDRLTVVAGEAALRAAVDRPVARASGLADRLTRLDPRHP